MPAIREPDSGGVSVWCPLHWSVVPELDYPGMLATMALTEMAIWDEAVMRLAGWNPVTGQLAETGRLNAVLQELSPLCCHYSNNMETLWNECLAARDNPAILRLCKRRIPNGGKCAGILHPECAF